VLAFGLALLAVPMAAVTGSADQAGVLLAQRQQLQQQARGLGADRAQALSDLLAAEDALHNVRAELDHNRQLLADLGRQQATLLEKIRSTQAGIDSEKALLATLTRSNYKAKAADAGLALVFDSRNFGQMVNSLMNQNRVQQRLTDVSNQLRAEEATLRQAGADLAQRRAQAAQVGTQLEQENARMLALVADHDARVAALDADQRGLLLKIASVNQAIAIAQAPPPAAQFSAGSGSGGGGGSCGNHFDYGYCTWYVANRRCIPWFGNADEWYTNARSYGFPEGKKAKVGAVAVWGPGGGYGSVGHVAYVESVQSDGFTVSEYNYTYGWNRKDSRFVAYSGAGPLYGFIYGK
jgi:surface antigen